MSATGGDSIFPQSLTKSLWERLEILANIDENFLPIRLSVDETEEVIRILWEFVGHMGHMSEEARPGGYEEHLIARGRHWAQELQTAMLAAVAHAGPTLIQSVRQHEEQKGNSA